MSSIPAIIITDLESGFFKNPAHLSDTLADLNILQFTLQRTSQCESVSKLIVLHPASQNPQPLINHCTINKEIEFFPYDVQEELAANIWRSARKWARTSWRGGLNWATSYDEAMPLAPINQLMSESNISSALILRADWPLCDPSFSDRMIAAHLTAPDSMRICFTQSPPGLSAFVTTAETVSQFLNAGASVGRVLGYDPHNPSVDPISLDVNIAIPPVVRDCNRRFVYDSPRSISLLQALSNKLGTSLLTASAEDIANAVHEIEAASPLSNYDQLPQQITFELNATRKSTGLLTPQQYIDIPRQPIELNQAKHILDDIASNQSQDTALLFAGAGDPLLYPEIFQILEYAKSVGINGIGLETDLLTDDTNLLDKLIDIGIDLLIVNINADTQKTYEQTMGPYSFKTMLENLQHLFKRRLHHIQQNNTTFTSWIVPSLTKTKHNVKDMEGFFLRWILHAQHAIIKPFQTRSGLLPDLSPVPMEPPARKPCRQLGNRMTILCDGSVPSCDQDYLAQHSLGSALDTPLLELWQKQSELYTQQQNQNYNCSSLCSSCKEWFRP